MYFILQVGVALIKGLLIGKCQGHLIVLLNIGYLEPQLNNIGAFIKSSYCKKKKKNLINIVVH